jgi:hypothetical protein
VGNSRPVGGGTSHRAEGDRIASERYRMLATKAEVGDPSAETFAFRAQKTMYGGKHIAEGDRIFLFAGGNRAGPFLSHAAW